MAKRIVAGSAKQPLPPGVIRQEMWWGDMYSGRPDDLVRAGLIRRDQVPEPRKKVTYVNGQRLQPRVRLGRDIPYLKVTWDSKTTMNVHIGFDAQALKERAQKRSEEQIAKQEAERAKRDLEYYSKPENLRKQALFVLRMLNQVIAQNTEGAGEANEANQYCRFSSESIEEVTEALDVIRDWIRSVPIHLVSTTATRLEVARKDAAFVAFMRSQCLGG